MKRILFVLTVLLGGVSCPAGEPTAPAPATTLRERIDHDYLEDMKPQIVAGRFFSREIASDASGFLVSETAVRVMGMP